MYLYWTGYHLAEILTFQNYKSIKNLISAETNDFFIGLTVPAFSGGCAGSGCSSPFGLVWDTSGIPFIYHAWFTGGMMVEDGLRECITVKRGNLLFDSSL